MENIKYYNLWLIDIDGAITEFIYTDELVKNQQLLMEKLDTLKPFDWFASNMPLIVKNHNIIFFITGRKNEHEELTIRWIQRELNLPKERYTIFFLPYKTHDQYLNDKIKKMKEIIVSTADSFVIKKIFIIDDDTSITKHFNEHRSEIRYPIKIYEVKDGIAEILRSEVKSNMV